MTMRLRWWDKHKYSIKCHTRVASFLFVVAAIVIAVNDRATVESVSKYDPSHLPSPRWTLCHSNDNYLGPHSRLLASRSLKSISDFYSASRSEVITLIVPRNPLCDTGPVPTTSACSLRACCARPFDCFLCRAVPCVSGRLHWVIRPARDLIRCLKDLFHFKR